MLLSRVNSGERVQVSSLESRVAARLRASLGCAERHSDCDLRGPPRTVTLGPHARAYSKHLRLPTQSPSMRRALKSQARALMTVGLLRPGSDR